jgi:hypothetical protein
VPVEAQLASEVCMGALELETPQEFAKRGVPGFTNARVIVRHLRAGLIPRGPGVRNGGRWYLNPPKVFRWLDEGGNLSPLGQQTHDDCQLASGATA